MKTLAVELCQWTPNNLDGKKVYDKGFLLALRNDPASRKKPNNLLDVIVADDRRRVSDGRYCFNAQSDKLKNKPLQTEEPLGSRQMFGNWSKRDNINTDSSSATNSAIQYLRKSVPQTIFVQSTTGTLVYQGQPIPSQFTFQPNSSQTPKVPFSVPFYSMRQSHPSQSATVPPNANQPLDTISILQTQPPFQRQQNKRRAIPVIDPDTGLDRLDEVYETTK